ncbi:MAG TPA: tetratricopeptide repeat protein, partial [Draconibacterium sp.]|nr:tetratricopeptide repeat protein [Draconibacterium sp.]
SLLVFSLSLLSKIQAVALPFSILLIDYWMEKKLTLKSVINKIPFFLLSLVTGLVGIYFLRQQGSLDVGHILPFTQRVFVGSYSYMVYVIKSIFPYQMSAIYPMPLKLSALHYLSMIPSLAIVLISFLTFKTKRFIAFGLLFFTMNVVFVLQVVGAGTGFISDRFTYIPYIGLFFIYAIACEGILKKYREQKIIIYSTIAIYLLIISAITLTQIKTWKNGETLWTNVIEKQPGSVIAYNNLGQYYSNHNQPEKALNNYNISIQLLPDQAQIYNNRGKIFFDRGEFDKALEDYNKSLSIDPEYSDALANRGAVYGVKKQYEKAIEDFSEVIKNDHKNTDVLSNRGFAYYQLKEYEKSIADCNKYLQLKPKDAEVINLSGLCYAGLNNFESAINEYNKAIQTDPGNPIYYLNRSFAFNSKGDKTNALKDALQAGKMGFNVPKDYLEMLAKQ